MYRWRWGRGTNSHFLSFPRKVRCSSRDSERGFPMAKLACAALMCAAATSVAHAQIAAPLPEEAQAPRIVRVHHENAGAMEPAQALASLPGETWAMSLWQQQAVYDPSDNKIGDVNDILMDHDGK